MFYLALFMEVCSPAVKIAFTVSTGLLTSVCAVASLISVSALSYLSFMNIHLLPSRSWRLDIHSYMSLFISALVDVSFLFIPCHLVLISNW